MVVLTYFFCFRTKDLRPEAKNFEVFFVHTVSYMYIHCPTGLVLKLQSNIKCSMTKHVVVWLLCVMLFDLVWFNLKSIKHIIKQHQTSLLFSCLMCGVWFVWPASPNMFDARKGITRQVLAIRIQDARNPFPIQLLGASLMACLIAFGHVIKHGESLVAKHFSFDGA